MYATLFDPRRVAAKKEAEHAKKEACSRLKLWALELVPAGLRLRVTVDEVAHEAGEGQVDTAVEFWGLDNELRNGVAIEAPAVDVSRDELEKRFPSEAVLRDWAAGVDAEWPPPAPPPARALPFAVGATAEVWLADRWRKCEVAAHWHRCKGWPRDAYVPYALKLFRTGRATYAPTESHVRGNALDPEWKQRCPKQPKKERKKEKPLEGRALEEKEREEEREKEVVHKREGNVIDMTTGYDVSRKWRENARNRDHKPWRDKWKTDGNVIDFTDAGPRRSRPGAVEYRDEPDPESPYFRLLPYVVRLDGSDRHHHRARGGDAAPPSPACFGQRSETAWLSPLCGGFDAPGLAPLRFEVGDAVEALVEHRLGEEAEWVAGAVAKVWSLASAAATRPTDLAARPPRGAPSEAFEEDDAERRLYHREDARRAAAAARARSVFSASEAAGRGCVVA
ncbi:hypothetical protein SO694_000037104 [Aureococcus anophagefferens]|uniref:Uncharacterized protein n=1 Tax=Aureococcus anophagefferens TaxID=44056 RepID=A0ABR1GDA8_AURAN